MSEKSAEILKRALSSCGLFLMGFSVAFHAF
jgi:hypothetical protein